MTGFPFVCPVEVRFRDVDAMGHVNNAVFGTYLEIARTRLWRERLGFGHSARDFAFILARMVIDFRSPIALEDEVTVGAGVHSIGTSSFTLAYRIEASGRLAAEGETVQVAFDYETRRTIPIEADMRVRLSALQLARAGAG